MTAQVARRLDARGAKRAVAATALLYLGVFAALFPAGLLLEPASSAAEELTHQLITSLGLLVVGLLAIGLLGPGSLRESFAERSHAKHAALGALLGVGLIAINIGLVLVIRTVESDGGASLGFAVPDHLLIRLVAGAVLPALFEEWLCRGVLWTALRRLTDARATIALTAILFALLHGLGGLGFFEVPTRLVIGLGLGWLRYKTGSLMPCVFAHFVNNAIALSLI